VPEIYRLIASFPRVESYALSDQLRRAAVSIAANIAEGQARRHRKEFLQHLSVAKGSLAEIHTLLVVAEKLGYLTGERLALLEAMLREIRRPLFGLIASLE
jgi:four helix bundle protein